MRVAVFVAIAAGASAPACSRVLGLDDTHFVGDGGGGQVDTPEQGVDGPPPDTGIARVTSGLVARWDFDEGSGATVGDSSGAGAPLDLTISGQVTWLSGALRIDAPTLIASAGAASKVSAAAMASNEITVEAWFVPANLDQAGPARLVTCSLDTSFRNFHLGQNMGALNGRFRTTITGNNGVSLDGGALATALVHGVMTRSAIGEQRLFVGGSEVAILTTGGDTSTWDASYRLALANELTLGRPWLGELHLVAIYGRALTAAEVAQNYQAGATAP
jgi:hypothetical protein